jgi:hypothetical protein
VQIKYIKFLQYIKLHVSIRDDEGILEKMSNSLGIKGGKDIYNSCSMSNVRWHTLRASLLPLSTPRGKSTIHERTWTMSMSSPASDARLSQERDPSPWGKPAV